VLAAGKGPYGPLGYIPVPVMNTPPITHPATPATPPAPDGQASVNSAQTPFEPNAFTKWTKAPASKPADQSTPGGNAFTPPPQQPMPQTMQQPLPPPMQPPMQPAYSAPMMNMPANNVSMTSLPPQPVQTVMYMAKPPAASSSPYNTQSAVVSATPPVTGTSPYNMQSTVVSAAPVGYTSPAPTYQASIIPAHDQGMGTIHQASMQEAAVPMPSNKDGMLIGMMHDALFPSQRETAAERLAASSPSNPAVIAAMVDVARHDPAVSVRTCCIRCLAAMHAGTPEVRAALEELRNDSDAAVAHEATDALLNLAK